MKWHPSKSRHLVGILWTNLKGKNLQTWNIKGWIFMTSIFKGTTKKKFLGASSPLNILQIPAVRILKKHCAYYFRSEFSQNINR